MKSSVEMRFQKTPNKAIDAKASLKGLIKMIDTYDRPGDAYAEETYARSGIYKAGLIDKPRKRIPKIGVYAEAGIGRAKAEFSVFDAEAKGPNVSVKGEASLLGLEAMARPELVSASATAGPVTAKLGLCADTGVSAGIDGFEVKILGTGYRIGPRTSISLFGSELSFQFL